MKIAFVKRLIRDEGGASALEMGLICALIVLVMMSALQGFANESKSMWGRVATTVSASNKAASGG